MRPTKWTSADFGDRGFTKRERMTVSIIYWTVVGGLLVLLGVVISERITG